MQVALVLYPGVTALDVLGPYEVFKSLNDCDLRFVASQIGPMTTDRGLLLIGATHTFAETPKPDLILIPGSEAHTAIAAADKELVGWLKNAHPHSTYTTSVCSGAVILASAGLLKGRPATTHWAAMSALKHLGARPRPNERIVQAGKIWSAAGVSAGLDLALKLFAEIEGQAAAEQVQLMIEYDPQPPFDAGHMSKAPKEVVKAARKEMAQLSKHPRNLAAVSTIVWQQALAALRLAK